MRTQLANSFERKTVMSENNKQRNNPNRQSRQGSPNDRRRQGQPSRQGQSGGRRPAPNREAQRRSRREQEKAAAISSAVKGIIAILLTLLIVIVVIMLFWKNLFTGSETGSKATGTITTPTSYIPPETKTATEREETKKTTKKKTTEAEEEEEEEEENTQTIRCTGAVFLHPEPNSKSATLLTIPSGADVKFYRNENNWYYVEYNGQQGYAWGNYFTDPTE